MTTAAIRAARAAQHCAARAVTRHGLAHPVALALLTVAAMAAAKAWDTGHSVADTHLAPARKTSPLMPNPSVGHRG
ncbi:hypothetical protein [Streptomyces sp. NPDC087862]|uniref:hypothetical protein n=1 Tax=Streptomyces sp. NPDC087862 TaxID=3365813 RepID=UPI0037F461A0